RAERDDGGRPGIVETIADSGGLRAAVGREQLRHPDELGAERGAGRRGGGPQREAGGGVTARVGKRGAGGGRQSRRRQNQEHFPPASDPHCRAPRSEKDQRTFHTIEGRSSVDSNKPVRSSGRKFIDPRFERPSGNSARGRHRRKPPAAPRRSLRATPASAAGRTTDCARSSASPPISRPIGRGGGDRPSTTAPSATRGRAAPNRRRTSRCGC